MSKNEHHPPMESHTHGAAGIKVEHEARKSNYAANVEHHKNEMISDDHNDEEIKYLKMMEENFPNLKEANQNDTSSKDNVNSPIETDDVPTVPPKKSYLNIAKTPQPTSKKVPPSIPKTTSKVGEEANKVEGKKHGSEDNRKIFINNLSYKTTDKTLRKYFQQFGEVEEVLLFIDPKIQKICYGFVTMKKAEDAKKALQHDPHPFINDRTVYLEAYEGTKRKNKHFATPSNSSNQLPQLQEIRKIKPNPNIDDQKMEVKLTSNKVAHPNEKDEKHIVGHLSRDHDDNLSKDNVINFIKSDEIPAVPPKKSYLNVAQASPLMVSKKVPVTTSKVGDEDADKKKNLAYKAKEIEKNKQENNNRNNLVLEKNEEDPIKKEEVTVGKPRKSYLDAFKTSRLESKKDDMAHLLPELTSKIEKDEENEQANLAHVDTENAASEDSISESFKSAQENIPSEDDIYERKSNLPNESKIEASKIPEVNEKIKAGKKSKTKGIKAASTISEMIANIASPDEGTSDEKLGDNSSLYVPIHPSSSKLQGESRGGSKKGNKMKKKGVAKNVVAKGNETEPWELADLGDSPQILEEKDQKKSTKNKSADAMTSSDVMAIAAKQREAERADERANYLVKSLTQFEYWKFLDFEIALPMPKTNEEYKRLINDALKHMDMDKEKTSVEIVKLIYKGCQKRRLKYIRLIGAGSLRQQGVPYRYDKEMREKDEDALKLLGYGYFAKYIQQGQIFALYQLALVKRIAELFKVTPAHVTVEDLHFDESEKEFLEGEYGYTTISDENETHENLVKIPSQVAEMGPDEVTLIIILNCPIKMTTNLIKSYGEHSKQLILMESSMSDLNAKKHTNIKDKENFQQNRRKFQIRKPLPVTFLTKHVFKQKDENDVQICYANLNKN